MTTRTIDGKTYYEYTPQELDEMRLKKIADHYQRNGQQKFAAPTTSTMQTINKTHKRNTQ
jgi:hypothetical protein